jgi:hypothetical protein
MQLAALNLVAGDYADSDGDGLDDEDSELEDADFVMVTNSDGSTSTK